MVTNGHRQSIIGKIFAILRIEQFVNDYRIFTIIHYQFATMSYSP